MCVHLVEFSLLFFQDLGESSGKAKVEDFVGFNQKPGQNKSEGGTEVSGPKRKPGEMG